MKLSKLIQKNTLLIFNFLLFYGIFSTNCFNYAQHINIPIISTVENLPALKEAASFSNDLTVKIKTFFNLIKKFSSSLIFRLLEV